MWKELLARGIRVGKERVRKLMQRHGIKARGKRKFVVTTDSKHNLPIASNLLERNFAPQAPNQVWTSDITYIATDEGWLYLTGVIDLFSRQVRELATTHQDLAKRLAELELKTEGLELTHDAFSRNTRNQLKQVFDAIRDLMTPPEPPKRPIGFITQEDKPAPKARKGKKASGS